VLDNDLSIYKIYELLPLARNGLKHNVPIEQDELPLGSSESSSDPIYIGFEPKSIERFLFEQLSIKW